MRLSNKFATPGTVGIRYNFAKSLLLKAVNGDEHLPDAFTELVFTNNAAVDLEAMKLHMLKKVALYDDKDNFLKTGTIARSMQSPSTYLRSTMMLPQRH